MTQAQPKKGKTGKAVAPRKKEEIAVGLRSLLMDQWEAFEPHVDRYQWPREEERWKELAFCVLNWAGQPRLKAAGARRLVCQLEDFGMLDLQELAARVGSNGEPDYSSVEVAVMQTLLERQGVTPERARTAVGTLCQLAFRFRQRYGGKVQRYFRRYGEQMLADLDAEFSLTEARPEDSRRIFAHWLQNVLCMPISLRDSAMIRFSKELGVTPEDVVAAADQLGINVALLDDMLECATGAEPDAAIE